MWQKDLQKFEKGEKYGFKLSIPSLWSEKKALDQVIPQTNEEVVLPYENPDPIGDQDFEIYPGLIHRYQNRILFHVTYRCGIYCRFCFRKEKVSKEKERSEFDLEQIFKKIDECPDVDEVILSGGDPFILSNQKLIKIFDRLLNREKKIRIHTRFPVFLPSRFDEGLLQVLEQNKEEITLVIHTNTVEEWTNESISLLKKIPNRMYSQTVLLRGINDSAQSLKKLYDFCFQNRIQPLYLHYLDPAKGTSHFRVSLERAFNLDRELRKICSSVARAEFVIDLPNGHGKVPISSAKIVNDGVEFTSVLSNEPVLLPKEQFMENI